MAKLSNDSYTALVESCYSNHTWEFINQCGGGFQTESRVYKAECHSQCILTLRGSNTYKNCWEGQRKNVFNFIN